MQRALDPSTPDTRPATAAGSFLAMRVRPAGVRSRRLAQQATVAGHGR
ncbi:hypothetical protein RKD20_006235 [Streptomyces sp. SLBN-8D4]